MLSEELYSISIEDLVSSFKISVRAYNVCVANELSNAGLIIEYFIKKKSFLGFKNLGAKTQAELNDLCLKIIQENNIVVNDNVNSINTLFGDLKDWHIEAIERFAYFQSLKLSKRASNALKNKYPQGLSIKILRDDFFSKNQSIREIEFIGKKTEVELSNFFQDIEKYANEIEQLSEKMFLNQKFILTFKTEFNIEEASWFDEQFVSIDSVSFPLFSFLKYLLDNKHFLEARELFILEHRSGYFLNTEILSLNFLAKKYDITRERVRQITLVIEKELSLKLKIFLGIKNQFELSINNYLSLSKDFILINQKVTSDINGKESCDFTSKFICKVFGTLYEATHCILGENYYFENFFLINREFCKIFDFDAMLIDINLLIEDEIENEYTLDFEGYLFKFFKTQNYKTLSNIKSICQALIFSEYIDYIEINIEGDLIFKQNKMIAVKSKYIIELLTENGNPLQLQDMFDILTERYLGIFNTLEGLRSLLARDVNVTFIGRSSTYGLVKWETERNNFRGGTIRDLAEEFLSKYNEPKHYFDIFEYISKFRPETNANSINSSLQLDTSDRFTEIGYGFWGVKDRNYLAVNINPIPKFFIRRISKIINNGETYVEVDLVHNLAAKFDIQIAQVRAFLDKSIKEGKIKRENDRIFIC